MKWTPEEHAMMTDAVFVKLALLFSKWCVAGVDGESREKERFYTMMRAWEKTLEAMEVPEVLSDTSAIERERREADE